MEQMKSFIQQMNHLGSEGIPFLFVIDFDQNNPFIIPLKDVDSQQIMYEIGGSGNVPASDFTLRDDVQFELYNPSFEKYEKAFNEVMWHLKRGDSYLLNLTQSINISTNLTLTDIFMHSSARYKLCLPEHFVVFSPEPFVHISEGIIRSHPMKGTIDAMLPDAEQRLLDDPKELAEHYTIVDLLRNDLNMVSQKVRVNRFRYVEEIHTHRGQLLQTSSDISGILPNDYQQHLGDIMARLLPAGSVSGAPKKRTVEIIHSAENYERGFYTGVFGVFDGSTLDSAVMIRFIEQTASGLVFKAGGGITVNSRIEDEFHEMLQKVYLPLHRKIA